MSHWGLNNDTLIDNVYHAFILPFVIYVNEAAGFFITVNIPPLTEIPQGT